MTVESRPPLVRLRRFPWGSGITLALVSLFAGLPLYWMLAVSLKTSEENARIPATLVPESITLEQYAKVIEDGTLAGATVRSLVIAFATTAVVVLMGSLAAYSVTYLRFRGTSAMLSLSLVTQLLPQAAVLVPIFVLWTTLGLIGTIPGVILVYIAFQLPVAVWIISGHFSSIPPEIFEAAEMDGSSRVNTLFRVVLPIAAPGIAAVAIWCVIGCWSELLFALVLLGGNQRTVPSAIAGIIGEHLTDYGMLLAGATLAALPPLILFFFVQKYFTNGIAGAVKG